MSWKAYAIGHGGDDMMENHMEKKLHHAYKQGHREAMEHLEDGEFFGMREGRSGGSSNSMRGGSYGGNSNYGSRSYGERDEDYWDNDDEMYGERRGVPGTGPYSRLRRRRYRY